MIVGTAVAKLPALSEEAQQKAAEAAARAAWNDKIDNYKLCKAQDRIAANYRQRTGKPASASSMAAIPSCADPGAFTYTPSDQKPLESAEAHSPPGTAASPPNTTSPAAATRTTAKP
jgi:hypothetical protein